MFSQCLCSAPLQSTSPPTTRLTLSNLAPTSRRLWRLELKKKTLVGRDRLALPSRTTPCYQQHFKGLPKDKIIFQEKEVANLFLWYGSDSLNRRPRPHTKQDCKGHKVVPPTPWSQWIHKVVNLAFYVKTGQELLKSFSHLGDYNLSYSTQYLYVRTSMQD